MTRRALRVEEDLAASQAGYRLGVSVETLMARRYWGSISWKVARSADPTVSSRRHKVVFAASLPVRG